MPVYKIAAILVFLLLCSPLAGSAQPAASSGQQQRDLRFEKDVAPEAGDTVVPRGYALIIGVARYRNLTDAQQLQFAERDAEAIYSVLISPEGGNFRPENVRKLVGPRATLANIRAELEGWLPSVAAAQDRVLVYFAGHGFVTGGRPYLAPYDLDPDNIPGTGYSMDALSVTFGSRIKSRWKVLLTDACHSGAITPERDVETINRSLIDLNSSVFSLTASRDREKSFESPDWGGGHGIFTYYVVSGLDGAADENRNGVVTADELAEYVRSNVREATSGRQNPTSDGSSFDPDMLLAYNATNIAPTPKESKFGTWIIESNMDGVEVFLDSKSVGIVNRGAPLRLPGLPPGIHTVRGVKMGYEPDGPREEWVYPGQDTTVSIKIQFIRRRNPAAADLFDRGLEYYNRGAEDNYRKAGELFQNALDADPTYSRAALYLARTYNALYEQSKAKEYFQRAISIDPDFTEARASFGGMLLDIGDTDEAIRNLNAVIQREPGNAQAHYLLAQAFRMKNDYRQSIEAARRAIEVAPHVAEAHFWLAESLRMSEEYQDAVTAYSEYLRLSDFDSKLAGKLNYYVVGFLIGKGKKSRAAQHDIWQDLRSLAYFGLCDSERQLERFDRAIGFCHKSLSYDAQDPYAHYVLALSYLLQANSTNNVGSAVAALKHFTQMIEINSDIAEARYAKENIANIRTALSLQE